MPYMVTTALPKELPEAWRALYSMEGPPQMEDGLQRMEHIFPRLPYGQRQRLQAYLSALLYNGAVSNNGSAPALRRRDIITGMVVAELAGQLSDASGKVPETFYRALDILPPHDERTQRVLGETLSKYVSPEAKLARIRDIALAADAEAAFRIMRREHGILVLYNGIQEDIRKDEEARASRHATSNRDREYLMEGLEDFDFSGGPRVDYE